jgi:hypothetical protein
MGWRPAALVMMAAVKEVYDENNDDVVVHRNDVVVHRMS